MYNDLWKKNKFVSPGIGRYASSTLDPSTILFYYNSCVLHLHSKAVYIVNILFDLYRTFETVVSCETNESIDIFLIC
jgi:hypothetical protein